MQHGASGMSSNIILNTVPPQASTVEVAEPRAFCGQLLVDWVAHCGAASVVLGVIDVVNENPNDDFAISVSRVQLRCATTSSSTSQPDVAHAKRVHVLVCGVCHADFAYCFFLQVVVETSKSV